MTQHSGTGLQVEYIARRDLAAQHVRAVGRAVIRWLARAGLGVAAALCAWGGAHAQVLEQKLVAPDMALDDRFGQAVALLPDWAFVSKLDDEVQVQSGAIYVYRRTGAGWVFAQKLKSVPVTFGSVLGWSLSASGDWLVAGSPFDHPPGGYDVPGSAHVYHLQGGVWVHTQQLLASDYTSLFQRLFGWSVCVSGDRMVIGERDDHTAAYQAGSAYVFELQGGTWVEVAKLYASDFEIRGTFGTGVAIDGDRLVVGAPSHDNGGPDVNPGAAYVFERQSNGAWVQTQKLVASDSGTQNFFGYGAMLEGDTIFVNAPGHRHVPQKYGAVYVFQRQGGQFVETQEIRPWDQQALDGFGNWMGFDGELALFSAQGASDANFAAGAAYVYREVNGTWQQIAKLIASDSAFGDNFGNAVAISGERVLIGCNGDDDACPGNPNCSSGSAYIFELAPDAVQFCGCPAQGPCGNHGSFGGCKNSSGFGAILAAAGSSSVTQGDLHLQATWLPKQALGIFLMGSGSTATPLGDGQLCLGGGNLYRFKPGQSSFATGTFDLGGNIAKQTVEQFAPGGWILPGSTWNFQAWFRDNQGPCVQRSNLTNAVRVHFLP